MKKKTGLSLFWRCFITYCICAFLFGGILLYSYQKLSSLWQTSYLSQTSDSLSANARKLSDSFYSTSTVPKLLQATDYFNSLTIRESLSSPQDSYYLSRTMTTLGTLKGINYLNWEVLIYLKRPGVFLNSTHVYQEPDRLFQEIYQFEQTDFPAELALSGLSATKLRILPEDRLSLNGQAAVSYLPCLMSGTGDSCVWVFLIPKTRILELFQVSALPENSLFELRNEDGEVLVSSGTELPGEAYISLSTELQSFGGTARIRIPENFLKLTARKTLRRILLVFSVSMIAGLFLCFFFSRFNAEPVRALLKQQEIPLDEQHRDELFSLNSYLSSTKTRQTQLKQQLQSNLLVCAFFGIPVDEQELKRLVGPGLLFEEPTRIAILRFRQNPAETDTENPLLFHCREQLPDRFLVVPINRQELGLLFPEEEELLLLLKNTIRRVNCEQAPADQIICGVSAPFTGCHAISDAVRQALFYLPSAEEDLTVFSGPSVPASAQQDLPDIKAFQNALFTWNREEIRQLLTEYSEAVRKKSPAVSQQVFYTLLSSIRDSAAAIQVSTELFDECTFAKSISASANIRALQKLVDYLFEKKAVSRKNEKDTQLQDILNYMKEHLSDPSMSVTVLAGQFHRSERVLNSLVMKATGLSAAGYLLQLRMQYASDLLRDSELDVNSIAERCGMTPSTFYRNYKKFFHMTPTEYKDSLEHGSPSL